MSLRSLPPPHADGAGALLRAGAILLLGVGVGAQMGGIRVGVAIAGAIVMLLPWHRSSGPRPPRRGPQAGWRLIGAGIAVIGGTDAIGQLLRWSVLARVVVPVAIATPLLGIGLRWALTRRGRVHRVALDAFLVSIGITLLTWQWVWRTLVGQDSAAAGAFTGLTVLVLSLASVIVMSRGAERMTADRVLLMAAGVAYLGGAMLVDDPDLIQRSWAAVLDGCGHVLASGAVVLGQRARCAVDAEPRNVVAAVRWPPTGVAILALLSSIALAQRHQLPAGEVAELLQGGLVLALAGRFVQAGGDWRTAWTRLETSVSTDEVTGLRNRVWLSGALPDLLRAGSVSAVVLVDIDRFKLVNDALGHHVGDRLLQVVGSRLADLAGPQVVRSGGDEFLLLVDAAGGADPVALAAAVHRGLGAPVNIDGHPLRLSASVGVAVVVPETTAEELLRDAESALYRAKDGGRDQVVVYDDRLRRQVGDRMRDDLALRTAAAAGRLRIVYDPVVDATTGQVVQLRALAACDGAIDGVTGPRLRDLADVDGVVGRPEWLLDVVCRAMAVLGRTAGWGGTAICVDVSATRLRHPDFPAQVRRAVCAAGVDPRRLVLAVPEEAVLDPTGSQDAPLRALAQMGVGIALQGFGSGYTALGALPGMPIQLLHLDASFTGRLGSSLRPSLVGVIIDMAHGMGLRVVAEGVQTPAQQTQLAAMGCDLLQGSRAGAPLPLEDHLVARPAPLPRAAVTTAT